MSGREDGQGIGMGFDRRISASEAYDRLAFVFNIVYYDGSVREGERQCFVGINENERHRVGSGGGCWLFMI